MDKDFKLENVSKEELEVYMKDFEALNEKHSIYFEPVPEYTRTLIKTQEGQDLLTWSTTVKVFLQKKVKVEAPKEVEATPVESKEVDPTPENA